MLIARDWVAGRMEIPPAAVGQHTHFGDVPGYRTIRGARDTLSAGAEIVPSSVGPEGRHAHRPRWGLVRHGQIMG